MLASEPDKPKAAAEHQGDRQAGAHVYCGAAGSGSGCWPVAVTIASCHRLNAIMLVTLREEVSRVKMIFTHDTEVSLAEAAALVNTLDSDGVDGLAEPAGLQALPGPQSLHRRRSWAPRRSWPRCVRSAASSRRLWQVADRDAAVPIINEILATADARPFLTRHDEWDWHLHVTPPDAPLAQRMAAEAAMAFLELVRADDWARLKTCAADDCHDVLVDLSKNRSKRYLRRRQLRQPGGGRGLPRPEAGAVRPSRRSAVPPFAVMTVLQRVAELRATGREVISLCAGEPSQGAPSDVRRRLAELMIDRTPLGYSETFGLRTPAAGDRRPLSALVRPGRPGRPDRRHHRLLGRLPGQLPGGVRRR